MKNHEITEEENVNVFVKDIIIHNIWLKLRTTSILIWIICFLLIIIPLIEVGLTEKGILMSKAFYQLSGICFGMGVGIGLGRIVTGMIMILEYFKKTEEQ